MQHRNINIRRPATNIIFFKYLSEQTPKLQPNVVSIYGTYGLFPLTYEYNYQIKSNTRLVRCIGSNMGRFRGRGRGFLNISHCCKLSILPSNSSVISRRIVSHNLLLIWESSINASSAQATPSLFPLASRS